MTATHLLTFDVMSDVKFSADIREDFGRYMKREREERGLTQKYVADKIGLTVTQLSRIENGKSGTERDTVILWARVLGLEENDALRKYKPENIVRKPTNVAEFFQALDELGLDMSFVGSDDSLEGLGPEDLQDLLDGIKANTLIKVQRKSREK
jgi:transcriptional regulator with XRE-family HTH domain